MDDKKQTALDNAITEIEKNYGKGAIQRLGQSNGMDIKTISTGSLSIINDAFRCLSIFSFFIFANSL